MADWAQEELAKPGETWIKFDGLRQEGGVRAWVASTHIHYYFVNLLVIILLDPSLSWKVGMEIMDIRWIADVVSFCLFKGMTKGTFCTAQDIKKKESSSSWAILEWLYQYGWVWFTASVNIMCYAMIALVLKDIVLVNGYKIQLRRKLDASIVKSAFDGSLDGTVEISFSVQQSNTIAMQMLLNLLGYPAVYLVAIFPMSLVRWLSFCGIEMPFIATAFARILFSSSGILNFPTEATSTHGGLAITAAPFLAPAYKLASDEPQSLRELRIVLREKGGNAVLTPVRGK
ncbi:uncharacterized protein BT62DRAFT_918549 [Guyanagaster necrorhizus]|uniref:Uncharacterized protein n=1 Tax=Guyanagaster necrorhizus TaxID=856835 RepID=A0A9P7VWZ3_9AGAR|nr:uncharacterized protein BT62DRAFT_918549 [Guyanagaster necrorhizus MCA 3950]KAG7448092.1 hypothetical protein BT62DRAFT_918549 [Guyanagaster necrorhizus MCA 3950]